MEAFLWVEDELLEVHVEAVASEAGWAFSVGVAAGVSFSAGA